MPDAVKTQTRSTRYWHVRLVTSEGVYHPDNIGFVVMVEDSDLFAVRRGPQKKRLPTVVAEASWREAVRRVQSFLDNGPEGEFAGYELTVDILEWGMFNVKGVAQLY